MAILQVSSCGGCKGSYEPRGRLNNKIIKYPDLCEQVDDVKSHHPEIAAEAGRPAEGAVHEPEVDGEEHVVSWVAELGEPSLQVPEVEGLAQRELGAQRGAHRRQVNNF